ncbi:MAG TPA: hypothetical protein VJJ21_05310 [Candidatus Nanoarchaeia archaeon]|nr:hypothetical protein [Candidatus Nanoarchaeia archaeon]
MKITKQTHNPLLGRNQIELEYEHFKQVTPKESEVAKEAATLLKASPELMKVKHIYSGYGNGNSRIIVYVYDSAEKLNAVEVIKKKAKKKEEVKPAKTEK